MADQTDIHFLQHALRIGARNLGRTWPNPSVGCVLVKDGQVLAFAASGEPGQPHAEAEALHDAGERARGATAYVTLEPCSHHGRTPPCAEALIKAGVARVVVAAIDPNSLVAGKGMAMLRKAGIDVAEHFLPEAAAQHAGFFRHITQHMPLVLMKIATSADGQMADPSGKQRWITGERARMHGHTLRNQVDAVLTGIGTILADDPALNVRLPGVHHERLVRVVADRKLRLPLESQLVRTAAAQATWVITHADAIEQAASHATDLRERGVKLIVLEDKALTARNLLAALGKEGITRLLIEAGPALSTAFLEARLVDRLYWYRAPMLLGNAGQPAIAALHSHLPADGGAKTTLKIGPDQCDIFEMPPCLPA
jgi:diaminohydroxyphosphoribosylaminopyrimidine deaminase/5-amino-6-(5-phosphoribosylamino)uracil reductase